MLSFGLVVVEHAHGERLNKREVDKRTITQNISLSSTSLCTTINEKLQAWLSHLAVVSSPSSSPCHAVTKLWPSGSGATRFGPEPPGTGRFYSRNTISKHINHTLKRHTERNWWSTGHKSSRPSSVRPVVVVVVQRSDLMLHRLERCSWTSRIRLRRQRPASSRQLIRRLWRQCCRFVRFGG